MHHAAPTQILAMTIYRGQVTLNDRRSAHVMRWCGQGQQGSGLATDPGAAASAALPLGATAMNGGALAASCSRAANASSPSFGRWKEEGGAGVSRKAIRILREGPRSRLCLLREDAARLSSTQDGLAAMVHSAMLAVPGAGAAAGVAAPIVVPGATAALLPAAAEAAGLAVMGMVAAVSPSMTSCAGVHGMGA